MPDSKRRSSGTNSHQSPSQDNWLFNGLVPPRTPPPTPPRPIQRPVIPLLDGILGPSRGAAGRRSKGPTTKSPAATQSRTLDQILDNVPLFRRPSVPPEQRADYFTPFEMAAREANARRLPDQLDVMKMIQEANRRDYLEALAKQKARKAYLDSIHAGDPNYEGSDRDSLDSYSAGAKPGWRMTGDRGVEKFWTGLHKGAGGLAVMAMPNGFEQTLTPSEQRQYREGIGKGLLTNPESKARLVADILHASKRSFEQGSLDPMFEWRNNYIESMNPFEPGLTPYEQMLRTVNDLATAAGLASKVGKFSGHMGTNSGLISAIDSDKGFRDTLVRNRIDPAKLKAALSHPLTGFVSGLSVPTKSASRVDQNRRHKDR